MSLLLNVLWLIFGGGLLMGCGWLLAAALCAVSIVGLPWARAAFNLGLLSFAPFGRTTVSRRVLNGGRDDIGTGVLGLIGNVVWFAVLGLWLALAHAAIGVANCLTVVGIPFGVANFRLAIAALFPVGLAVVSKEEAARAGWNVDRPTWPTA